MMDNAWLIKSFEIAKREPSRSFETLEAALIRLAALQPEKECSLARGTFCPFFNQFASLGNCQFIP